MKPKISIIIPALNEEKYIGTLLSCLKKQTFKDFEIIVADAASTDRTVAIAKKYHAQIVAGGKQAYGRNNGAKQAKAETFLFLDADVSFKDSFLEHCYEQFNGKSLDIACCYFNTRSLGLGMKLIYGIWNRGKDVRMHTKFPDGEGQCLWAKKDVFNRLKGFDERLTIAEDVDLIHRAVAKGFVFSMLPDHFTPSPRRYRNVSILRVALGSLIGGIEQMVGKKSTGRFAELIYGGWGKYNV